METLHARKAKLNTQNSRCMIFFFLKAGFSGHPPNRCHKRSFLKIQHQWQVTKLYLQLPVPWTWRAAQVSGAVGNSTQCARSGGTALAASQRQHLHPGDAPARWPEAGHMDFLWSGRWARCDLISRSRDALCFSESSPGTFPFLTASSSLRRSGAASGLCSNGGGSLGRQDGPQGSGLWLISLCAAKFLLLGESSHSHGGLASCILLGTA